MSEDVQSDDQISLKSIWAFVTMGSDIACHLAYYGALLGAGLSMLDILDQSTFLAPTVMAMGASLFLSPFTGALALKAHNMIAEKENTPYMTARDACLTKPYVAVDVILGSAVFALGLLIHKANDFAELTQAAPQIIPL